MSVAAQIAVPIAVSIAVPSEKNCGVDCGADCGAEQQQTIDEQSPALGESEVHPNFPHDSATPNRVRHSTVGTAGTVGTAAPPENGSTQAADGKSNSNSENPSGSSSQKMIDETPTTIGAYYGLSYSTTPDGRPATFPALLGSGWPEQLTDGALNSDTKQWQEFDGADELRRYCNAVIEEFADQPYQGAATIAFVMDAAMQRFQKAGGGNVPRCWLKVLGDFKRQVRTAQAAGK